MTHSPNFLPDALRNEIPMLKRNYQRGISMDLSHHQVDGLLERQILRLVDAWLEACSRWLDQGVAAGDGTAEALTARLTQVKDELVAFGLQFNRSSCALSNFGEEHVPGRDYLTHILSQVESRWQQWCVVNHQRVASLLRLDAVS